MLWHRKIWLWALLATGVLWLAGYGTCFWFDRTHPLDLARYLDRGVLVTDRNGDLLHIAPARDGIFRLRSDISRTDKRFTHMLVAFEDKRFYDHGGVDFLALGRAAGQMLRHGRPVSGASTLTMQVARLLEPRPRTLRSKLIEMMRAWQLEARFSKQEILGLYLTLAPYGGNLEGIRAGSLYYFGREPLELTWGEAALMVALPQSPSRFRPDRHPARAEQARDKVLARVAANLGLEAATLRAHSGLRLRLKRRPFATRAPHLGYRVAGRKDRYDSVHTTLDAQYQQGTMDILARAVTRMDETGSLAALIVDRWTGKLVAYAGSPDHIDAARLGAIDMVRAVRSPGSTLKPFIYGMGFDDGFLHPLTLIRDEVSRFGSYMPTNFRGGFHGETSVRDALRKSLNIPAVKVLARIGPDRFAAEMALHGVALHTPAGEPAGLPLALGGVGSTLEDLVRLYTALAQDGRVRPLDMMKDVAAAPGPATPFLSATSRAYLVEALKNVAPPADLMPATLRKNGRRIAYKTGTSWGLRDAWAIGFDARWVVGVWAGKADGTPSPGQYGARTAAPVLFDLIAMLPEHSDNQRTIWLAANGGWQAGKASPVWSASDLTVTQRFFDRSPLMQLQATSSPPDISFPVDGSALQMPGHDRPVMVEVQGGEGRLSLLVNQKPAGHIPPDGQLWWQPDGAGFHTLTVVDRAGRKAVSKVRILP